jgi:predicted phage gp36 major capsid-like protein
MLLSMAVMARETWTDQRLDDFQKNVNHRFDEVERRFDRVEGDIRELRSDVKRVDGKVDALQSEMNGRFDSMQRTMIVCFSGMTASIVASVVGAILVTQL